MIVGVDFGAPRRERDQRRKLVAVWAERVGPRAYRVDASPMNARLLSSDAPGWTARDLVRALIARPARVVGFDFPFGIPAALLRDPGFAEASGFERGAFVEWNAWNAWVARRLPLADPLDFSPFARWRDPAQRAQLWSRRVTDVVVGAQPPLKDRFQATFQMTLLGNAVLAALRASGAYRVSPFEDGEGGELLEVYPGATLRLLGLASYKARPEEAVRLGLAACAEAGLAVDVDPRLIAAAHRYDSGTPASPDHDVADAFVALCTAILYAEGACRPAVEAPSLALEREILAREGAIWVPRRAVTPAVGPVATVSGPSPSTGRRRRHPA
jgi:hypothetical protein